MEKAAKYRNLIKKRLRFMMLSQSTSKLFCRMKFGFIIYLKIFVRRGGLRVPACMNEYPPYSDCRFSKSNLKIRQFAASFATLIPRKDVRIEVIASERSERGSALGGLSHCKPKLNIR